jgi:hypothetical protein
MATGNDKIKSQAIQITGVFCVPEALNTTNQNQIELGQPMKSPMKSGPDVNRKIQC